MQNPADASGTPDLCLCQVISQLMVSISLSVSMTGARTELPVLQTWKVTRYHRGQHKAKVFLFVFLEMKVLWQMYTKVQSFIHIYTHPQPPWQGQRELTVKILSQKDWVLDSWLKLRQINSKAAVRWSQGVMHLIWDISEIPCVTSWRAGIQNCVFEHSPPEQLNEWNKLFMFFFFFI